MDSQNKQMSARASAASAYAQADEDELVRSALNATVNQRQAVRAELAQGDSEELPQLRRLMRTVQAEVLDEQENRSEPTEALALAGASSLDTLQDACEEDLERPDWSVHFADTPLNVMEEAARIAREEHGSDVLAVISGVGTRGYYARFGFSLKAGDALMTMSL